VNYRQLFRPDQYVEPIPIEVSSNVPDYESVWDRIKDANPIKEESLDEKTLQYVNGIFLTLFNLISS
jgi:hypothetical protein